MSYLEAILFGIVQGITEFIPVSSTAHIIIAELVLGYNFPGLAFEIMLHIASALAVIGYYRKDLLEIGGGFFRYFKYKTEENRVHFRYGLFLLTATAITGILGLLLKGQIQDFMKTPSFIAAALAVTGLFLIIIERVHRYGNRREPDMNYRDSIIVGLGQTIAVIPGISRSGSTLVAALFTGLSRETAVRYSFILVVPIILGSAVLTTGDAQMIMWSQLGVGPIVVSFVTSFIFSWIGIIWLIDFLKKRRLIYFALYCFLLAFLIHNYLEAVPPTI